MGKKVNTRTIYRNPLLIPFIVSVILLAFLGGFSINKLQSTQLKSSQLQTTPSPTPEVTTIPSVTSTKLLPLKVNENQVECIGPDNKQFNTTITECKKLSESYGKPVDYIVNCRLTANCGGGTRRLKKSECDSGVCCNVGNGWEFYSSVEKCRQAQSGNTSTSNNIDNKKKVAFTTNYASTKGTYYCYEEAVNQLLNWEESQVKSWYESYQSACNGSFSESYCQSGKIGYENSRARLDDAIRQYCP